MNHRLTALPTAKPLLLDAHTYQDAGIGAVLAAVLIGYCPH